MELLPLGDSALLVRFGMTLDAGVQRRVRAALAALDHAALDGVTDLVAAYTSLAVHYDARALAAVHDDPGRFLEQRIADVLATAPASLEAAAERTVEIPVRYGGEYGPDLAALAQHAGLSEDEIVAQHAGAEYRVAMIGFAPGFPYLTGLPPALAMPRLASPRAHVPAGSVAIAGAQAGIYPLDSPGGWRLLGRTDAVLFDAHRSPAALLQVGDVVRFVPVSA